MISEFVIGEKFKKQNGDFLLGYDKWKNSTELEINGHSHNDYVNELDSNRPIMQLIKNDRILDNIIKQLVKSNFKKNIILGLDLNESDIEWASHYDVSEMNTRNSNNEMTPFILPINQSGVWATFLDSSLYEKSFVLSDGIIKTSDNYYIVESDFYNFITIISKDLKLDFKSTEYKYSQYLKYNDTITIKYSDTNKKYITSIDRLPSTTQDPTFSADGARRAIENFEFNHIYELYEKINDTSTQDEYFNPTINSKYIKIDYKFLLMKPFVNGQNIYNFIVFNETKKRLEIIYNDTATDNYSDSLTKIKDYYDSINEEITILYYVVISKDASSHYSYNINVYNETNFEFNNIISYIVNNQQERTYLINSGLLNTNDRVLQLDNNIIYIWDGDIFIQDF